MSGTQITPEELQALQGEIIPKSFRAGYVVLSYAVSCLGAFTTLEIMMRRTASSGWYNWFLIVCASISMGGIATWCMHFIADNAIILGHGEPEIQIVFSAGYTAISFLIPVIIEMTALWAVGSRESSLPRAVLGGMLAGLGASGMHYLGQYSILNYDCIFDIGYVIGALVLAVVAMVLSLLIFFMLRSTWRTSLWKRAICAVILASGVSGMHWLIQAGTAYQLRGWDADVSDNLSQSTIVTVVIVLSIVCCIALMFLTLLTQSRMLRAAKRAEQVVLAAAFFDDEGKICVTHEGLLPRQKIANSWFEKSMDDIFGVAHPVFHWMFRASRNWYAVQHLIPAMRRHLLKTGIKARMGSLDDNALFNEEGAPIDDYSVVFRELFCLAASELATELHVPVEKLGVMYDEMVVTGLGAKAIEKSKKSVSTLASSLLDVERGGQDTSIGKGQLLFLVNRVDSHEALKLQSVGFRFADPLSVNTIIANRLRMGPRGLAQRINIMRSYYTDHYILEPGVHLGCFGIRASVAVGRRGFDVLVRRDAKNQLPTMQAPFDTLEPWHVEYLQALDSKTVSVVGKQLYKDSKPSNKNANERLLAKNLLKTLEALKEEIEDPLFNDAMLIPQPFDIPCRGVDKYSPPGVASLIAFRIILPLQARAPGRKLTFTPLNLFKTQQRVYDNSPDHGYFARSVYREFKPLLDLQQSQTSEDYFSFEARSARPRSVRGSNATSNTRNEVAMGEHIDMYGNPLPSTQPYLGPAKVRFWDRPRSLYRNRGENSAEHFLTASDAVDMNRRESFHSQRREDLDTQARPKAEGRKGQPELLVIPASPLTSVDTPGSATEMRFLGTPDQKLSPPKTPVGPDEESTVYIDALFALTIAKRQV